MLSLFRADSLCIVFQNADLILGDRKVFATYNQLCPIYSKLPRTQIEEVVINKYSVVVVTIPAASLAVVGRKILSLLVDMRCSGRVLLEEQGDI